MKKPRQKKPANQQPKNQVDKVDDDNDESTQRIVEVLEGVEGLPNELKLSILQSISFSGPLPPPTMYEHYEQVLPGSADRILTMAEKEQEFRGRDNRKILHNDRIKISGSIVVSVVLIAAGAFTAYIGEPLLGGALGLGGPLLAILRDVVRKL